MKKKTQLIALALTMGVLQQVKAQSVGINTTGAAPNASAMLDVSATNRGVLIPNVALTATNTAGPITLPATSLLVYNTATAGVSPNNVTPGYYYNAGTSAAPNWQRLATGGGDDWKITGNSNATAGTHFLGTTNAQALDFRTNNAIRFRVANANQVHAMVDGTAALPFYSWSANTGMGMYRAGADILGFSTTGAERIRILASGQTVVNANTPQFSTSLFASVGNTTFVDAFEGSTPGDGVGVLGIRLNSSTGIWAAVQGENTSLVASSSGVSGITNLNNQRGVYGSKPAAGSGFGGLFLNDLGYSGGAYNVSDRRYKKDIIAIDNALMNVLKLKTYKYHYTEEELGGDHIFYYGFMAQDIEELYPDLVQEKDFTPIQSRMFGNGGKDLKIKAVNTISLVPILTKAIQEQQQIIESLEERIKALENR